MSPLELALQRARMGFSADNTTEANQSSKLQGIANKMGGFKIVTNPKVTKKGNTTCGACLSAKATGAPLPPEHPNCRCKIQRA